IATCSARSATVSASSGSSTATSSGNYSFSGVTPGVYTVKASAANYTAASKSIQIAPALTASAKLFLGTGSGQIKGTITDTSGTAVSGAAVQLTGSSSARGSDETIAPA